MVINLDFANLDMTHLKVISLSLSLSSQIFNIFSCYTRLDAHIQAVISTTQSCPRDDDDAAAVDDDYRFPY